MTTLTTTELAKLEGLGVSDWGEPFAAFQTSQGKQDRYTFTLPIASLVDMVKRPDPNEPFPGNRKVELPRARNFSEYLSKSVNGTHGWTFPPIQLRTTKEHVRSESIAENIGLVMIRVPRSTRWDIQDGQHRVLGVYLFTEETERELAALRNQLAKREDQDHRRRLKEVERIRRTILRDSKVEIVLVVTDERTHGQMFADIALNAKGINADFATTLNQRDVVDRIASDIIDTFEPLADLVSDGQQGRMPTTSPHLLGAKNVADICRGVIVGPGRVGKTVWSQVEEEEGKWRERIREFFAVLFESSADLERLRVGTVTAPALRDESLIASSTMWRALAIAWHQILYEGDRKSVADMRHFFESLEPHLRCFTEVDVPDPKTGELKVRRGVPEDHPLWGPTGKFRPGSRTPEGRHSDVNDLGRIFEKWAREGLPVATTPDFRARAE